ncbi:MAG: cadherin-like beta sandwich domain-containing protein, partial [Gammaproteobacteria bacterium]|nr:cadherin-like beta sandwich domain-containing protein [Gammaproteobacteria bacterium]
MNFNSDTTVDIKLREDDWNDSTPAGVEQWPEDFIVTFADDEDGTPLWREYARPREGLYDGTYDVRISLLSYGDDGTKGTADDVRGTEFSDVASIVVANGPLGPRPARTSDDATLSALSARSGRRDLSGSAELIPSFSPATFSYEASVANKFDAVRLQPTAANPSATITLRGTTLASRAEHIVDLNLGANQIPLAVTAADQTTKATYTLHIERRQVSSDATLSALSVRGGGAELVSSFSAATRTYAGSVANTVDAVLVTPTAADAGATLTVNGATVASGAGHSVSLDFGANQIPLVVAAEDQVAKQTYILNIERALPAVTVGSATVNYLEGSSRFGATDISVRIQPTLPTAVQVGLDSADGSARSGVDYTAISGQILEILANSAGPDFPVGIPNNELVEADKDFSVTLSKPPGNTDVYAIGTPATATVTIQDDDRAKAKIAFGADAAATAAVAQTAGEADGTRTFQVSISHSAETAVSFTVERDPSSTASENDYTLSATTLTFPANASAAQRTQNLEVSIQNDADTEPNELLVLRIAAADPSAPGLAKHYTRGNTARLTIANDDGLSAPVLAAVSGDSAGATPGIAYSLAAAVESATTYSASYKKLSPGAPDADFTEAAAIPAAEGADNLAFSVRGLDAASVYELRVRAVDSAANSSDPVSAVARTPSADCVAADTSPCPPSAPRLLLLTPRQGAIAATWAAPAYAGDGSSGADFSAAPQITGYEISHQRAGGGEAQVARADATALVETIGGLEPFEYTVRVRAQNDARAAAAATGVAAESAATPQPLPMSWGITSLQRFLSDVGSRAVLPGVTGGVPPLSYALSGLPSGMNWRNSDNSPRPGIALSGSVPGEKANIGNYAATLFVLDSAQPPNTARFNLDINIEDNRAPRIVPREGVRGLGLLGAD